MAANDGLEFSPEDLSSFRSLPPRAKTAWYLESLLASAAALVMWSIVFGTSILDLQGVIWESLALVGILSSALVELLVLIPARFKHARVAVLEEGFVSVSGGTFRRTRIQPWRHVLYVEVRQGPLLSKLGLYRVRIGTISGVHVEGPLEVLSVEAIRAAAQRDRAEP